MYQCGTLEKALGTLLLCALESKEIGGTITYERLLQMGTNAGFTPTEIHDAVNSLANLSLVNLLVRPSPGWSVIVQRNAKASKDAYVGTPLAPG